jgi:hypothetical protein
VVTKGMAEVIVPARSKQSIAVEVWRIVRQWAIALEAVDLPHSERLVRGKLRKNPNKALPNNAFFSRQSSRVVSSPVLARLGGGTMRPAAVVAQRPLQIRTRRPHPARLVLRQASRTARLSHLKSEPRRYQLSRLISHFNLSN